MSNPTLTFSLTPDQWGQAKALVKQKLGLSLVGDSGQADKLGVTVHFEYADNHLAVYVVKRGLFDPSVSTIDQDITTAIESITNSTE